MSRSPTRIALVGIGKIARDQHIPTIAANPDFELVAAVTSREPPAGTAGFKTVGDLIASDIAIDAVSLCTPPQGRHGLARQALEAGLHVMLEKPPGATTSEVDDLVTVAATRGVSLYATWHSREASGVEPARRWLQGRKISSVAVNWKEDVRRWHPGQQWIWEPGGLGVFDPGINALSVLTRIMPAPPFVTAASLDFPSNCAAPIAAFLDLTDREQTPIHAEFDFLQTGPQTWDIVVETDGGRLQLTMGGAKLAIDGKPVVDGEDVEYAGLYRRFAQLVEDGASDVDLSPFRLVADAFMLGRRNEVEPFIE